MRGATIAEVAAEAGVGVGTVSRVLNGSPAVSDRTRRRVLEAIATLDYQPSAAARALSTGRTGAIGVIAPFFTQPSVIERLSGVSRALTSAGYELILFDVERAEQLSEFFNAGSLRGQDRRPAVDLALPVQARGPAAGGRADARGAGRPRARAAFPASTSTTRRAAGSRPSTCWRSAIAGSRSSATRRRTPSASTSSALRREGFEAALEDAGVPARPELVRRRPHGRDAARVMARELLALADPPTAIFAASDGQAIGVLEAAARRVSQCPRLSVLGFDDVERGVHGPDHLAQPLRGERRPGAELLLRVMAGETVEARRLPLAMPLSGLPTAPTFLGEGERTRGKAQVRTPLLNGSMRTSRNRGG